MATIPTPLCPRNFLPADDGIESYDFGSCFIRWTADTNSRPCSLPNVAYEYKGGYTLKSQRALYQLLTRPIDEVSAIFKELGLPDYHSPIPLYQTGSTPAIIFHSGPDNNWKTCKEVLGYMLQTTTSESLTRNIHKRSPKLCVISEPVLTPTRQTAKYLEFLVEETQLAALGLVVDPISAICSLGMTSGFVIETGEAKSQVAIVMEGALVLPASRRMPAAGRSVTNKLLNLLQINKGYNIPDALAWILGTTLKQAYGFVVSDITSARTLASNTFTYLEPCMTVLPDGSRISLENEKFECCEHLVTYKAQNDSNGSLVDMVLDSIMTTDTDTRAVMLKSISIHGGTAKLRGLTQRLMTEIPAAYALATDKSYTKTSERNIKEIKRPGAPEESIVKGTALLAELNSKYAFAKERTSGCSGMWRTREECIELGYARVVELLRSAQC